jgi:general L-amino acid transport system permease protein
MSTLAEQTASARREPPKVSPLNDPRVRGIISQVALLAFVLFLVWGAATNAYENLRAQNIASGFGFLDNQANFALSQALIPYTETDSYGRAFIAGLLNTLLVAAIGIVLASILGVLIGLARLSSNLVVRTLATWYVEVIRNLPLVLQLMFWYTAVLQPLPNPRDSISLFGGEVFLNNRGITLPKPLFQDGAIWIAGAVVLAFALGFVLSRWSKARQIATGQTFPVGLATLGLLIALPVAAFYALGQPISLEHPQLGRFNLTGGLRIIPEFVALLLGLVFYTAGFIAEIVRAGIQAVHRGQSEAAGALGLRPGLTTRLVVMPQALRVIIPPLTSQFLNLTKNSTLAVAIGYPDLFLVAGTINNQTGQAIEVIAMIMLTYLTLSLATSGFMNWYNQRVALVER